MIISGVHWIVAAAIAVWIHLVGILWLSQPMPERERLEDVERVGDSIVVTLGGDSRTAAVVVDPVETESAVAPTESNEVVPEQDSTVDQVETESAAAPMESDEAAPEQSFAVETPNTASDALANVELARIPLDLETPDAKRPREPDAAPEVTETALVRARAVESTEAREVSLPESETLTMLNPAMVSPEPEPANVQKEAVVATISRTSQPMEIARQVVEGTAIAQTGVTMNAVRTPEAESARVAESRTDTEVRRVEPPVEPTTMAADPVKEAREVTAVGTIAAARQPPLEIGRIEDTQKAAPPVTMDLEELVSRTGGAGVTARYAGVIKGWLQRNMHYPRAARLAGQEGEVVVRFVIDRTGKVQSIELESPSGYPLLDREAREMIERGDPFPPIPEEMPGLSLEVRVPASFHVRDETRTKEIPPIILE